jgi:MFS family permease
MTATAPAPPVARTDRLPSKWSVLSNTTLGMLMATVNASILIISLPAIFNGIHLDPLAPGNVSYLLWMLMGYMLVTAVLVVTLGRLGDMYGRVRIYSAGFAVFTAASIACALTPAGGQAGALWLIGWRLIQGVGGAMLMANSAAIITDAFPARQRGTALGVNQVAALAGSFIGLVLGGVLSAWHWRSVFWVSVVVGVIGSWWAYRNLRETAPRRPGVRVDWWGNLTLAVGLTALLAAITYGIQPYAGTPRAGPTRGYSPASSAGRSSWSPSASSRPGSRSRCSTWGCSGSRRSGPATPPRCSTPSPAVGSSSC